jgi:hypothetical protein
MIPLVPTHSVTLYSLTHVYQRFGITQCLHLWDTRAFLRKGDRKGSGTVLHDKECSTAMGIKRDLGHNSPPPAPNVTTVIAQLLLAVLIRRKPQARPKSTAPYDVPPTQTIAVRASNIA